MPRSLATLTGTDDGFTKNAKHCFLLWSIVFLFFFNFQEKTNAVIFHINLYFFCGCANFFKKMESPPAKFESFGLCIPAILWSYFKKKCLCVRQVNCEQFSVDICILKGDAEYKCKCWQSYTSDVCFHLLSGLAQKI